MLYVKMFLDFSTSIQPQFLFRLRTIRRTLLEIHKCIITFACELIMHSPFSVTASVLWHQSKHTWTSSFIWFECFNRTHTKCTKWFDRNFFGDKKKVTFYNFIFMEKKSKQQFTLLVNVIAFFSFIGKNVEIKFLY